MSLFKLAAGALGAMILCSAQAQKHDDSSGVNSRIAPRIEKNQTADLRLPTDLPAVASADAMTSYLVPELSSRQSFAFDPASFRRSGKIVMFTVTATSTSGASTSGYYAVNCSDGQYRLLGFPSAGKWKNSTRTKWRKVVGVKRQLKQLIPLHTASCKGTNAVVSNATELADRLQELSDRTN